MPVARIITTSPAHSDELRRQLTAAGYSVKFAAPDEEFSDADIVVAAANVHVDYALQYASEVASEADADVVVARGVAPGSQQQTSPTVPLVAAPVQAERLRDAAPKTLLPKTTDRLPAKRQAGLVETLETYRARAGEAWLAFRQKRELVAEQKRLHHEQREAQRTEARRALQERRRVEEARLAAERERLRVQRQAEEERLRREQEEMQRAMAAEQARLEAEKARVPEPVIVAKSTPATVERVTALPPRRPAARAHRPITRRTSGRDRRFQRAAMIASVVALVAMLGFAAALNIRPTSPLPNGMVQNPVQEQRPFGAAHITPATTTTPAASPKPVAHSALPQRDAAPVSPKASKPSPQRTRRAARDNYVAEDEVVVHHYGAAQKHPPVAQTQAGVRKFSDRE